MKYYWLLPNDLPANRWLIWNDSRETGGLIPKPVFQDLMCSKCWQANHDNIFKRGFEGAGNFKSKRDLVGTTDGFLCISDKVKTLLLRHKVGGFRSKPIGNDGWHVVNVNLKVNAVRVYTSEIWKGHRLCPKCKRALATGGGYEYERQISLPKRVRVFFTVIHEHQGGHRGPDIFVTEDVVKILQGGGIKGCRFNRLMTQEEEKRFKQCCKAGVNPWPADYHIDL